MDGLVVHGEFKLRYIPPPGDPGWDGDWVLKNAPTTQGIDYLLNAGFRGTQQSDKWYLGLINFYALAAYSPDDTYNSHPGWTEFTGYVNNQTAIGRTLWPVDAVVDGRATDQGFSSVFYITNSGSVSGIFVTDQYSYALNPNGIIYAAAATAWPGVPGAITRPVNPGGKLLVTYAIRINPRL